MIFEPPQDLEREKRAVKEFVKLFGGSFKRLGPSDVDYQIFDKDKKLIAYADIVLSDTTLRDAYPLKINSRKLIKIFEKRLSPVIIWALKDAIIYGKVDSISGTISSITGELTVLYSDKKQFKYLRL
jgi:hypothetical protein